MSAFDQTAWRLVECFASMDVCQHGSAECEYIALLVHQSRKLLQQRRVEKLGEPESIKRSPARRDLWKVIWL